MGDRKLRRSRKHRIIAGVLGGMADHFGLNATLLRVVYVLVSILSVAFPGIIVYILLWIIIPKEDEEACSPTRPEPTSP